MHVICMRAAFLFVLALALAGCGAADTRAPAPAAARFSQFEARGVTVELPPGWEHADVSLTPSLVDPREVLSLATFRLRYRRTACAHVAGSALEDLGVRDWRSSG
jgi:hypothetical protein